jgi:hypothetical protein
MKTLPALFTAALCALAVSAAPADAAKKPKYYFSITTTETYIDVADCKAIPSGRTRETTTTTRVITQTGHLGGGLTTEGWQQTDLKRESWDNEALPPYDLKGEKKFFSSKGRSTDELKVRGGRVTHSEFGPDYEHHKTVLRLPARVNRETSKRRQFNVKRSFPAEPGARCSYDYDNTHDVTVIIQRIQ